MEETSLNRFLDTDGGTERSELEGDDEPDPPTSRFGDGCECEVCGTSVDRLWRDDGRMCCVACKDWG